MRSQAEALSHTSVLVTPCGSLAALAYLLPPGATAVVMNFYHAETGANVQLDDAAFWNLDHVTLAYYPVGPEDYEGTSVSHYTMNYYKQLFVVAHLTALCQNYQRQNIGSTCLQLQVTHCKLQCQMWPPSSEGKSSPGAVVPKHIA